MAKSKSSFATTSKQYDTSNGFGSASEWREDFYTRMGGDEARSIVEEAQEGPWAILGVPVGAKREQIKATFRKLIMKWHEDHNPDNKELAHKMSQKIIAAYTILTGG